MKKQPLSPNLAKKKKNLLIMGKNIRLYKRQIIALQNELSEVKSDIVKALLLKELKKLSSQRNRMSKIYRYCHVAYSELRGTSRERIENPVRTYKLDEERINYFKKQ